MVNHFLNLLVRAIIDFPTVLSGNWISILLPLILYLLKEGKYVTQREERDECDLLA